MLHLGIDLHQHQITICLMSDAGDIVQRATVLTRPSSIDAFLESMAHEAGEDGYRAIIEVCGFAHWLIKKLNQHGCSRVVLVQPLKKAPHKTDKRDAASLAELLWVNRDRVAAGQRIHGLREVAIPSEDDRQDRLLSNALIDVRRQRTRVINQIKAILRRFNLMHDCPTKGFQTKAVHAWLPTLKLPELDQFVLELAHERWRMLEEQIERAQAQTDRRAEQSAACQVLQTMPGVGSLTALTIASRIGSIERFARPASLANMFGLTPSINDSGDSTGRVGGITKRGNANVRYLLGQLVFQLARKDPTIRQIYRKLKRKRGAKTAMVAVMRRIVCRIWHMLKTGEAYRVPDLRTA